MQQEIRRAAPALSPGRAAAPAGLAGLAGLAVAALGLIVLAGWTLDLDTLKSVIPGSVTMKPNTALALTLGGISLWALMPEAPPAWRRRAGQVTGLAVALIGGATLAQYLLGLDLGIDRLLFPANAIEIGTLAPGRPGPSSTLGALLLGTALLTLDLRWGRPGQPAQSLALVAGAVALLNVIGHAYGVGEFLGIASLAGMALHTALGFLALSAGILLARPHRGLMALVTSPGLGGLTIRRLLPAAVLVPLVTGWLRLQGERAGLYGFEFGLSLFAASNILALAGVIWWNARTLERVDAERRRAHAEVDELNRDLERRVALRTAELEAANRELEAFSYSVSHDLRAPLRAIDGFARILVDKHAPALPEEAQRYVGIVRDGAREMGRLVDDLLAFSHLGRQPLARRQVDVAEMARAAFDQLAPARAGRVVELTVGELPPAHADPSLLRQALVNLLENAVKFTRGREVARIEIGALPADDPAQGPVYFVRDNGAGFDMRYAAKLFGVFQRLHRTEEYEGTGVGLAIVQRIVYRHGGQVWAEASVGAGATFHFTLGGGKADG